MKDLITIIFTTLIIISLWILSGTQQIVKTPPREISEETLEIATPINGRIDVEFLRSLVKK